MIVSISSTSASSVHVEIMSCTQSLVFREFLRSRDMSISGAPTHPDFMVNRSCGNSEKKRMRSKLRLCACQPRFDTPYTDYHRLAPVYDSPVLFRRQVRSIREPDYIFSCADRRSVLLGVRILDVLVHSSIPLTTTPCILPAPNFVFLV